MSVYVILTFIIFINIGFSLPISKEEITIDVKNETYAEIKIYIEYKEITANKITYATLMDIRKLISSKVDGEEINCTIKRLNIGNEIVCPKIKEKNTSLEIKLIPDNFITKKGDIYKLMFEKPVIDTTDLLKVSVRLPKKAFIAESAIGNSINPPNFELSIDPSGRNIIVKWNIENPSLGNKYDFSILFEKPVEKIIISKEDNKIKAQLIYIISILLLISIGGISAFYIYITKHRKIINLQKEDDKKVIEAIKELGNGCKHKEIVKKTGFSKAKVSRILLDLEKRKIIRVERVGKNTKIYLN